MPHAVVQGLKFGTRLSGGLLFGSDKTDYAGSLDFIIGF